MKLEEYRKIKKDFQEKYFKNIKPNLEKFEQERIKKYKTYKITLIISIILFALCLVCLFLNTNVFGMGIFVIVVPFIVKRILQKLIEIKMKQEFMPLICSCFEDLKHSDGQKALLAQRKDVQKLTSNLNKNLSNFKPFGGDIQITLPDSVDYSSFHLVDRYNRSSFDDYFEGSYKGVNFKIIEADFSLETGSGDDKHERTIFDGIILKIESAKDFSSHTLIKRDTMIKREFKSIDGSRLKRTELEDVVFEKDYDVYTNDEVEARYLITARFMDKFNLIKKAFEASYVSCVFYDKNVYLALNTNRDMFQLCKLDKPINDITMFAKMFDEIISIYNMIDYLKLSK